MISKSRFQLNAREIALSKQPISFTRPVPQAVALGIAQSNQGATIPYVLLPIVSNTQPLKG